MNNGILKTAFLSIGLVLLTILVIVIFAIIIAILIRILFPSIYKEPENKNKRVYPDSVVREAVENFNQKLQSSSCEFMGEIQHPGDDPIPVDDSVRVVAHIQKFDSPEPTRHLLKYLSKLFRRK